MACDLERVLSEFSYWCKSLEGERGGEWFDREAGLRNVAVVQVMSLTALASLANLVVDLPVDRNRHRQTLGSSTGTENLRRLPGKTDSTPCGNGKMMAICDAAAEHLAGRSASPAGGWSGSSIVCLLVRDAPIGR